MAAIFYGALLAAACVWSLFAGRWFWFTSSDAAAAAAEPWRDLGAGLLAGVITILVSREFTRRTRAGEDLARAFGAVLGRLSVFECLVLAALSGLAEEAFFRGALQPQIGLVAASLLFGVLHFIPRREFLPWTVFAIAAGFLFGGLFEATGNLLAPVVAHATVNAVNLRFLSVHYGPTEEVS